MFWLAFMFLFVGVFLIINSVEDDNVVDKDGKLSKLNDFNIDLNQEHINILKNINLIKHTKYFEKLSNKQTKLIQLLENNKSNKLIAEQINVLFENSIKNILVINKVELILESLNINKLNKKNKELYKTNELFLKKEKDKFKESLELYDYIILKLIDIDIKKDYDYSEIQVYIDSIINSNKNLDLDYLENKYIVKNQGFEKTKEFAYNLNSNNIKTKE